MTKFTVVVRLTVAGTIAQHRSGSVGQAGLLVDVPMFIMRLSASCRAYPRAYLNEAQEVFLDGHMKVRPLAQT